jgi:hypothetical protein
MTFQPPPSDEAPSAPEPTPGAWTPPAAPAPSSSGSAGFDPKAVNKLDWGILGAGVLAFLFSFIDFYDGFDVSSGGRSATVNDGSWTAWHDVAGGGFFSWFAMIFAIVGAALVASAIFQPQRSLPMPARVIGLLAFAVALVLEIVGIFVTPGGSDNLGALGGGSDFSVSLNHGVGFWISLIVILAGTVLSLMRAQQTQTAMPGPLANIPKLPEFGK